MPDFGTCFRPDLLKGFKLACNRILWYYIRILLFYKFYLKIKRFNVALCGYWRYSRTIIRARVTCVCVCLYCGDRGRKKIGIVAGKKSGLRPEKNRDCGRDSRIISKIKVFENFSFYNLLIFR